MIEPAILARVPGCEAGRAPLAERVLPGGRGCNDVRWLQTPAGSFVLRRRLPPRVRPGADPRRELACHRAAAAAGLAPRVITAAPDGHWILMEYLAGRRWEAADLAQPATVDTLGEYLARLHGLPLPAGVAPFEPLALAREQLQQVQLLQPQRFAEAGQLVQLLAALPGLASTREAPLALCHGDLQLANCIGQPLRLVDWEYAQVTDPLHDVACLLDYYPALQARLPRLLAAAQLDGTGVEARLQQRRELFSALNRLWALAQPPPAE